MPRGKKAVKVAKPKVAKKVDERQVLIDKILADPRLPTLTEWEYPQGETRDLQRNFTGLHKDYGKDMSRLGVGMTGLMRTKGEKLGKG